MQLDHPSGSQHGARAHLKGKCKATQIENEVFKVTELTASKSIKTKLTEKFTERRMEFRCFLLLLSMKCSFYNHLSSCSSRPEESPWNRQKGKNDLKRLVLVSGQVSWVGQVENLNLKDANRPDLSFTKRLRLTLHFTHRHLSPSRWIHSQQGCFSSNFHQFLHGQFQPRHQSHFAFLVSFCAFFVSPSRSTRSDNAQLWPRLQRCDPLSVFVKNCTSNFSRSEKLRYKHCRRLPPAQTQTQDKWRNKRKLVSLFSRKKLREPCGTRFWKKSNKLFEASSALPPKEPRAGERSQQYFLSVAVSCDITL